MNRGKASCVCGVVGAARNIAKHRHSCSQWRQHKRKLAAEEQRKRERGFVLTPI